MHKKITKMRIMRYRIMKKKRFFWHFQARKASGGQSNTGNWFLEKFYIDYIFLKNFFYRSKPLVAKVEKKFFFSKKMETKSKTGVEPPKKIFWAKNLTTYLFSDIKRPAKIWAKFVTCMIHLSEKVTWNCPNAYRII